MAGKLGKPTPGDRAWFVLFVGVALYDWWASESGNDTMSQSFARAVDDPVRRWPTLAFWAYLTGHLVKVVPPKYDPLRRWN